MLGTYFCLILLLLFCWCLTFRDFADVKLCFTSNKWSDADDKRCFYIFCVRFVPSSNEVLHFYRQSDLLFEPQYFTEEEMHGAILQQ